MNSLEFINKEIERFEKKISKLREDQAFHLNYEHEDEAIEIDFEIEEYRDLLETLCQIKTKLEAWEVVKTFLTNIGNEYVLSIDSYYNKQEYEKLKKVLEVKDAKD